MNALLTDGEVGVHTKAPSLSVEATWRGRSISRPRPTALGNSLARVTCYRSKFASTVQRTQTITPPRDLLC